MQENQKFGTGVRIAITVGILAVLFVIYELIQDQKRQRLIDANTHDLRMEADSTTKANRQKLDEYNDVVKPR